MSFPPIGGICTFTCDRDSLALGEPAFVDSPHHDKALTVAGTVVDVKPMSPHGPGKVPTACVRVRGRTGKEVTIDGAACFLQVHETWVKALMHCAVRNGTTARALPLRPAGPNKASR